MNKKLLSTKGKIQMKNKVILVLLIAVMIFSMSLLTGAEHIGISHTDEAEKVQVVQLLGIMNGDESGNLNLDNTVTRAEFVKMLINASVYKDSVSNTAVALFPDVTSAHWAAPYISVAVKNGYITGYLDGNFRPDNTVKLEEAVTVVLKLLGYTNSDFQGIYPDAQLAKYKEISLDTAMLANKGEHLTRRECMKLIYNMLCTPTKNGAYYCTTLGYSTNSETKTIDFDLLLEKKISGPYVNTAENLWYNIVSFADKTDAVFYVDDKKAENASVGEYDVYYYSEPIKTVWIYTTKKFGSIGSISPSVMSPSSFTLNNGEAFSLTAVSANKFSKSGFEKDDYVMVLLDRNGKVAEVIGADNDMYLKYSDDDSSLLDEINNTISKPVVVTDAEYINQIPFDLDKAEILLDGDKISAKDIRQYDVLYYSVPFNSVWVFRETKNGVCTSVSPSRENPSSVTVGGKSYSLSTDNAKLRFSNYGSLKDEMLVTLLLGKDGSVVDALAADLSVVGDGENQVSYADVVNATLKGPFIVQKNGELSKESEIRLSEAVIYRKNKIVTSLEISKYDVYYYSKLLNTVWLYDDTKSGTVEAISPNRASPSSVMLSGNIYSLEGATAKYEFSSLGNFGVGDRVTLLLGKDGNVAGVVPANELENKLTYGVVLSSGEKTYTDKDGKAYTSGTITVFTTEGDVCTYQTGSSFNAGRAVKISVGDDKVNVTGLSSPSSKSYALKAIDAVKNNKFAKDAEIIEYYNSSIYSTVVPSRIAGSEMSYRDIIYYELNADGEIQKLILDDYTGDLVEYGLVTYAEDETYKYILNGTEQSYNSGDSTFFVEEGPAYFVINGNKISKLGNIKAKVNISVISGNVAYNSSNQGFEIADDVKVYIFDSDDYKYKEYDADVLKSGEYHSLVGYYDKAVENGGRIRIIMASY